MSDSDSGGIGAKKGFLYQDYVAALFTLNMLVDKKLHSIRCEVKDDIDLIYDDYIEYIQVKTTKADKSWLLSEFTKCSYKIIKTKSNKEKKDYNKDSILHKSLNCDVIPLLSHFRIVTPRDVHANLNYLKIPLNERPEKKGRDKLLKSLQNALKKYTSPQGKDVEYWLDNAVWEVIPNIEQITLKSYKLIIQVAFHQYGITLNPIRDPERILNDLLVNLIEKSATSIVLHSIDKKTYTREHFNNWFQKEIEHYGSEAKNYVKVYSQNNTIKDSILNVFSSNDQKFLHFNGAKSCRGLHGKYHLRSYSYKAIAKGIMKWLPSVLLRPGEITDHSPERLEQKISVYVDRKKQYLTELNSLISHVLLHSTLRTNCNSLPIPAHLYVNDRNASLFENIHIVINQNKPDELIMGFNYIINGDISIQMDIITEEFNNLLDSEAFDTKLEKILEVKEDNYLLKHDINEILQPNSSLDENLDRFKFVFFLGYESKILACNSKDMSNEYLSELEQEITQHFTNLINHLVEENDYYSELCITIYLYPIPSLSSLTTAVKEQMEA